MINPLKTPLAYRVVTSLVAPFLPLLIRMRLKAGKEDPARQRERYGVTDIKRPLGTVIWMHGASVGETQMLRPIIARLLQTPGRTVLVTSGTKTSADLMAEQLPEGAIHQYLPLDTPRATARFIGHWRPDLAVFAESEIWPNLIWTAQRAGVPLALINARMSEKSLAGWAKRLPMARSVFGAFDTILTADRQTADGIATFAMNSLPNIGNLKLDAPALDYDQAQFDALRAEIGNRKIWLAASTHEAEEEVFHRLHSTLREEAYMIWVPRHPERGQAIADRLGTTARSHGGKPRGQAYVMDTMGEMGLALALADICVLGGSFHPSLMGHNPLEAARAGVPVITGPYHASFVDLFRKMNDFDAIMIADPREAVTLIRDGLNGRLDDIAANAQGFASQSSGTLDRTIQELEQLL
ncbi:3-deoxy-D-manno-octulosonic acid transferase [Algimonas arctica]|uniref:3-deoxy-D-manno-octulosonic acid transferase n=1 Tax=Algimonas arctica TaxID=1479486 RepID=A0A8J3CPT2_9PROT|nr:3-deoxy-D-manno-octulosonic acid transferase [Algimonas arctica]GHA92869.1 3-deoxy-D-manno-octulosonic acid transferase [Algimonas arctica]